MYRHGMTCFHAMLSTAPAITRNSESRRIRFTSTATALDQQTAREPQPSLSIPTIKTAVAAVSAWRVTCRKLRLKEYRVRLSTRTGSDLSRRLWPSNTRFPVPAPVVTRTNPQPGPWI